MALAIRNKRAMIRLRSSSNRTGRRRREFLWELPENRAYRAVHWPGRIKTWRSLSPCGGGLSSAMLRAAADRRVRPEKTMDSGACSGALRKMVKLSEVGLARGIGKESVFKGVAIDGEEIGGRESNLKSG